MANSRGLCDLHPGISAGPFASPAASHSGTSAVHSLRQTNPHSRHSSTLSKTLGLSSHHSLLIGERPNTDATFSVSHLSQFTVHTLAFMATLPVIHSVQITLRRLLIQKSYWSQFRMSYRRVISSGSHLSHTIYSVPQSALYQSK